MTIHILKEIEGTNLVSVEIDHSISIKTKEDVEKFKQIEEARKDESTICGYPFGDFYCKRCDNYECCKSLEKRK